MSDKNVTEYVGDGVYATFDGYGLEIRVNDHTNPIAVYFEPEVLQRINHFYKQEKEKGAT